MRVDFVKTVTETLSADERGVFVTGDLGFNALEGLRTSLSKRFINVGVAEQNMVGMAAGLALAGYRPWVYSIAPFATYRCLEQIRNDVCLHNLPVRIVGNGGGYTYGIMGSTHHALEDVAVLKALPNIQLYLPCSNDHVAAAVKQIDARQAPSYLRLAISAYNSKLDPIAENPQTLTRQYARGERWTLIGVGHGVQLLLAALQKHQLSEHNVAVFGVARYPFDLAEDHELARSVERTGRVLVVEEHYRAGSLAESLSLALPRATRFETMCPAYALDQRYGSPAFHMQQCGLTPERVVSLVSQES
jgi:transketolase